MLEGAKLLGAGAATIALAGAAVGIGNVFSSLIHSVARNPSLSTSNCFANVRFFYFRMNFFFLNPPSVVNFFPFVRNLNSAFQILFFVFISIILSKIYIAFFYMLSDELMGFGYLRMDELTKAVQPYLPSSSPGEGSGGNWFQGPDECGDSFSLLEEEDEKINQKEDTFSKVRMLEKAILTEVFSIYEEEGEGEGKLEFDVHKKDLTDSVRNVLLQKNPGSSIYNKRRSLNGILTDLRSKKRNSKYWQNVVKDLRIYDKNRRV